MQDQENASDSFSRDRLDRLVYEHLAEALRLATRLTGCPDRAEDLCQDALVRVAKSAGTLREESAFRPWLLRIITNVFRDQLRRKGGQQDVFPDDVAEREPSEAMAGLLQRELHHEIGRHVSALPPRQREVVVLNSFHNLSPSEIADILDTNVGNVRSTLHIARERLRKLLAPYLSESEL